MKLCVVGCGSVGSALLHLIGMKSLEYTLSFNELVFVDPDIITTSNHVYYNYPKVFSEEDKLVNMGCNLKLHPMCMSFETYFSMLSEEEISKVVFIDCRDSLTQSSQFFMKIFSDGPYGHIIKYPHDNKINKFSNYRIKNSSYYSFLTVSYVIEDILNLKEKKPSSCKKQKEIVINHLCSK